MYRTRNVDKTQDETVKYGIHLNNTKCNVVATNVIYEIGNHTCYKMRLPYVVKHSVCMINEKGDRNEKR